tara:strand:- start:282 stop:527 length:246 start_codon:yes stop_codon:yes gene_type:complete
MSPLTGFILIVLVVTLQISIYTYRRLKEPIELDSSNKLDTKKTKFNFWQNAEITNGRLAMMGFFAIVINYGFFGWIVPGFF